MSGPLSNPFMFNAAADADFYEYQIANSLRVTDGGGYLETDSISSTNNTPYTASFWVKRSKIGSEMCVMGSSGGGHNLQFEADNTFMIESFGESPTTAVYRDVSAWYHIHIKNPMSDNIELYINGVAQTLSANSTGAVGLFVNGSKIQVGCKNNGGSDFEGYIAELYAIYNQTLAYTVFGEFKNGVWVPKDASSAITFGSNDFYLKFANSSNLGLDSSGQGNNLTNTGSMGADHQTGDTPTFDGSSNGGNFCTANSLIKDTNLSALDEGNLKFDMGTNQRGGTCTFAVPLTGKWYWEASMHGNAGGDEFWTGISLAGRDLTASRGGAAITGVYGLMWSNYSGSNYYPRKIEDGSLNTTEGGNLGTTTNSIVGVAVNRDDDELKVYVNNTLEWTMDISATNEYFPAFGLGGAGDASRYLVLNFGQDGTFAGNRTAQGNADGNGYGNFFYSPPTGHVALCAANLPTPATDPASEEGPNKYFVPKLYTGTGSSNAITGVGFQPDLVWISQRSSTEDPSFYDSSRGTTKRLKSSSTEAESTVAAGFTAFGSDGFTVGSATENNASTQTYVAWCWKANGGSTSSNTDGTITTTLQVNSAAGFSIGTYTGTGSNATVGHGLGARPDMSIFRERGTAGNWIVTWQPVMASNDHNLYLQITNAESDGNYFQNTAATTSVISIGTHADINGSSNTYVMYNWINVEGFSKFGSYEGNGAADGTFVYCGFRPAFVMTKSLDSTSDWSIFDIKREGYNVDNDELHANDGDAEGTADMIDIYSNGFKSRIATDPNVAETYVFMAMADNPFKYATAR